MKQLSKLHWDDWNKKHIKKHQVEIIEVEEAYKSSKLKVKTKYERIIVFGKTKKGRLLTIVLSYKKQKNPYVVSSRDMSRKERKKYI